MSVTLAMLPEKHWFGKTHRSPELAEVSCSLLAGARAPRRAEQQQASRAWLCRHLYSHYKQHGVGELLLAVGGRLRKEPL